MIMPMTLKYRWIIEARRASLEVPTEESTAVMQVPMFWPMMTGIATA